MDEPSQADLAVIEELIRVNRDIVKAIALVRSGASDTESGELVEIAETHLDTGMKLLTRAAIPLEDRQ